MGSGAADPSPGVRGNPGIVIVGSATVFGSRYGMPGGGGVRSSRHDEHRQCPQNQRRRTRRLRQVVGMVAQAVGPVGRVRARGVHPVHGVMTVRVVYWHCRWYWERFGTGWGRLPGGGIGVPSFHRGFTMRAPRHHEGIDDMGVFPTHGGSGGSAQMWRS